MDAEGRELARDNQELRSALSRVTRKLALSAETVKKGGLQLASGIEAGVGGALAGAADSLWGTSTNGGIPEITVFGNIPAVPVAGVVLKLVSIGLHVASKGKEDSSYDVAASHLGNLADGVLAGSAALMTARIVAELKAGQPVQP